MAEASTATSTLVSDVLGVESLGGLADAVADGMLEVDGVTVRFAHPLLRPPSPPQHRMPTGARCTAVCKSSRTATSGQRIWPPVPPAPTSPSLSPSSRPLNGPFRRGAPDAAAALARRSVALTPAGAHSASARRKIGQAEYEYRAENLPTAAQRLSE